MGNCISAFSAYHAEKSRRNEKFAAVLGNRMLLAQIFSNISKVEDLKHVRRVSRLWREESLEMWREAATLRLNWRKGNPSRFSIWYSAKFPSSEHSRMTREEFSELWAMSTELGSECPYQLARKPFARFRLHNCNFLRMNSEACKYFEEFVKDFGRYVRYLNLHHCCFQPGHYENILRWIICDKLVSLEELSVCLVPAKWELLGGGGIYINLGRLRGAGHLTPISVSSLRTLTLQLSKSWPRRSRGAQGFGLHGGASLSGTFPTGISFPHLAKLYLIGERRISFRALRVLEGLKLLWIEHGKGGSNWNESILTEWEDSIFENGGLELPIFRQLEHLHLKYDKLNTYSLTILRKWMPNLKRIDLVLDWSPCRFIVLQLWPNVEEVINLREQYVARD